MSTIQTKKNDLPKVYLAGAASLPEAFVRGWRMYAADVLASYGIETFDPIKDREIRPGYCPVDIVETDLYMIDQSDIILAELTHEGYPYIGTCMELRTAFMQGKPVIIWGNAYIGHYWLDYHVTRRFSELYSALLFIGRKGRSGRANTRFWARQIDRG